MNSPHLCNKWQKKQVSGIHVNENCAIGGPKEIGHEEPYYNTKIYIFSFTWAGLAVFHKSSTI